MSSQSSEVEKFCLSIHEFTAQKKNAFLIKNYKELFRLILTNSKFFILKDFFSKHKFFMCQIFNSLTTSEDCCFWWLVGKLSGATQDS